MLMRANEMNRMSEWGREWVNEWMNKRMEFRVRQTWTWILIPFLRWSDLINILLSLLLHLENVKDHDMCFLGKLICMCEIPNIGFSHTYRSYVVSFLSKIFVLISLPGNLFFNTGRLFGLNFLNFLVFAPVLSPMWTCFWLLTVFTLSFYGFVCS